MFVGRRRPYDVYTDSMISLGSFLATLSIWRARSRAVVSGFAGRQSPRSSKTKRTQTTCHISSTQNLSAIPLVVLLITSTIYAANDGPTGYRFRATWEGTEPYSGHGSHEFFHVVLRLIGSAFTVPYTRRGAQEEHTSDSKFVRQYFTLRPGSTLTSIEPARQVL